MARKPRVITKNISSFAGLNTVDNTTKSGTPRGPIDLAVATNVDIDKEGKVHRRDGYSLSQAGQYKYLWSDGSNFYGISGEDLVMLDSNFTSTTLREGIGNYEVIFTKVASSVYYTNSLEVGYIESGVATVVGDPTANSNTNVSGAYKVRMPAGVIIRLFNSRLLVAKDNTLYFSDGGGLYDQRDEGISEIYFSEDINMMEPVEDGVFVSADATYFLKGDAPEEWVQEIRADYKAIKGTSSVTRDLLIRIDREFIDLPIAVVWVSEKGVCIGSNKGFFKNLTKRNYEMPTSMLEGTSVVRDFMGAQQFISIVKY